MADFKYKARDKFGKLVTGSTVSENEETAAKKLKDMGYTPISIAKEKKSQSNKIFKRGRRISLEELNTFTRQLYTLQKAGLPLLAGLEAISLQTKNQYFKFIIEEIIQDVKGGSSLSSALSNHSHIFNEIYVNMMKAAEAGGMMVEVLYRLTELIEQEIDTRQRVKSATRYPMIAFFVLCIGFLIIITFVIPRFANVYGQFNTALPLPTRILIAVNFAITKFWYLFILGSGASVYAFLRFIHSEVGRPIWDNFKLKVPVFGPLITLLTMSRFARVTSTLMSSGVGILQVLDLVANTSGNIIIARAINGIKESVNQGKGMSEPMKVGNLFPPIVVQMVSIGEQTGKVDALLLSVADYYDREAGYMIKNLTTYIEPILISVLASMVLLLALGIFMPMWNLIRVFKVG